MYQKLLFVYLKIICLEYGLRRITVADTLSTNVLQKYSGQDGALIYLTKYGYMDHLEIKPSHMALTDFSNSLKEFQENMGINKTGVLDDETLRIMNLPRCSNTDKVVPNSFTNKTDEILSKYSLYGTKWDKEVVTYRITQYSYQRISHEFIDSQIALAFETWGKFINLRFSQSNEKVVDIEIRFTHGSHGDNFPFPSDASQLAHAFYPPGSGLAGDVHFNDAITWNDSKLFYTALHEIGHSLGLRHSSNQKSVMYSHLIQNTKGTISLHQDDISGIQAIYGVRHSSLPQSETSKPNDVPTYETIPKQGVLVSHQICQDGRIDAITAFPNGKVLVFKDEEVIILSVYNGHFQPQQPQLIRNLYSSRLPSKLDAVFTRDNNKTYFFKGNLYWRTTGFTIDEGYPKLISRNFPGIPDNLDAASIGTSNEILFFKDSKFWKFNPRSNNRSIAFDIGRHWRGIPVNSIEAAMRISNDTTYFFSNSRYWRFNHSSNTVPMDSSYPRDARLWWFSCREYQPIIMEI